MEITAKEWNLMSKKRRDVACKLLELSEDFINSNWSNFSDWHRRLICEYQNLSAEFIFSNWDFDKISEKEKTLMLKHQKNLPMDFLQSILNELSNEQRDIYYTRNNEYGFNTNHIGR